MTEYVPGDPEADTPVNPYSLLEAVNRSSDMAHTGWLIFLGVMAYLMIAVAGVTHVDLLLEKSVQLPIFGIEIPQIQFFQFAPILLVLFHLGIVSQLVLLARKTLEFDLAVQQLETGVRRTHPLRLELHNFFFVQGIAGSSRSRIMGAFLHGMSWLTLVVIPVLLLLFIQIKFLPYHSVPVTWAHRIALLTDIAMMILIGVFLIRPEASFFKAVFRTIAYYPLGFLVTVSVFVAVALFSLFIATIPGERLDRLMHSFRTGEQLANASTAPEYAKAFAMPSFLSRADGSLFGLFHRNLIVQDYDLVANRDVTKGESTLNLRDRDLRYARLDRSDLHQADFTGANIEGASFEGSDLRNVRLQCADLTQLILLDDRNKARCSRAALANFTRANLNGAQIAGADLRGAIFEDATMVSANLSYSLLAGARFTSANLKLADFSGGVKAQGADFLLASLEGANLKGAELQFADFSSASMQGAYMPHAKLQGAVFRDANMEAVALHHTRLEAAILAGAQLEAADLRWARIWMTEPPAASSLESADLSEVSIAPLTEAEAKALRLAIEKIEPAATRELVRVQLESVLDKRKAARWSGTPASDKWQVLAARRSIPLNDATYPVALSEQLAVLACRDKWPNGSVATGVALRAISDLFRGSKQLITDRMAETTCAPAQKVSDELKKQMTSSG